MKALIPTDKYLNRLIADFQREVEILGPNNYHSNILPLEHRSREIFQEAIYYIGMRKKPVPTTISNKYIEISFSAGRKIREAMERIGKLRNKERLYLEQLAENIGSRGGILLETNIGYRDASSILHDVPEALFDSMRRVRVYRTHKRMLDSKN